MNSKRKGNSGELEILHLLEQYGIPCQRNDQRYKGGVDNPDIGAEIGGAPIHIEVKRCEALSIYAAMEQAAHDANGHALPVVCHRRNNEPWLIVARLEDVLTALGYLPF